MTPEQVEREIRNRIKRNPGYQIIPKLKRSANRGNGSNRNFEPKPTNGWDISSTHMMRMENAEGNMALVPIRSKVSDRTWTEIRLLDPNERKIRRMKNKMRKLHRSWRRRKPHGRTVTPCQ